MKELYEKLPNGRYQRYVEPKCEDNKLYVKRNNKYEPWGMELKSDSLNEGVWVVTRDKNRSGISGKYLRDIFTIEKCSNLQGLSLAQLGNIHKLCDEALYNIDGDGKSVWETFEKRVGYVIDKLMEK